MRIIGGTGLPPAAVTLPEFKAATPMAESSDFDTGLTAMLAAATDVIETATNRALALRDVEFLPPVTSGGGCSWSRWWFPIAPVAAVTTVEVWDGAAWVEIDAGDYALEDGFNEPQLVLASTVREAWPDARLRVRASCGHAGATVPEPLKQAVILTARDWHLAGAGLGDAVAQVISFTAQALIRQRKYVRPQVVA
jgi:uncharacterized phiE125 gp8 family phage protein